MFWNNIKDDEDEEEASVPEICLPFLGNACSRNSDECSGIHARWSFLWQSRHNFQWHSIPETNCKELELAYRDVSSDGVRLTPVVPEPRKKTSDSNGSWYADFDKMTLVKGETTLKLRRLSTSSSALSNDVMATEYEWYFKGERNNWIKFGRTNRINNFSSESTSSNDIETYYLHNSKPRQMCITYGAREYILDFLKMTRKSESNSAVGPIRRRVKMGSLVAGSGPSSNLSTEAMEAVVSKLLIPDVAHQWQVKGNGVWYTYGETRASKVPEYVSATTSDEVEKQFSNFPSSVLVINGRRHRYQLDFENLMQTNQQTSVELPIRRIPIPPRKVLKRPVIKRSAKVNLLSSISPTVKTTPISLKSTPKEGIVLERKEFPSEEYEWFFKDENNSWIKYGSPNTSTNVDCFPLVTSEDIDKHFVQDSTKCMDIASKNNKYWLDFGKMTQTNKNTFVERPIRRVLKGALEDNDDNGVGMTIKVMYEWYFKDEYECWTKFGFMPESNTIDYGSNLTSGDIEKHFLKNRKGQLDFKSSEGEFALDLVAMTQMNKDTKIKRAICRRSKTVSITGFSEEFDKKLALPSHWTPMKPKQVVMTVLLNPSEQEYNKYLTLVRQTLPNVQIQQMYRIQNPFLWRAYINMKECKSQKNPTITFKEMYLYHGTNSQNVQSICEENVDWRLYGTSTGTAAGRGSYFGSSAAVSAGYCISAPKAMFIMKVLVGNVTPGNNATQLPALPGSGGLYDTTVDNVAAPSMYVKYDTQEYYPECYFVF